MALAEHGMRLVEVREIAEPGCGRIGLRRTMIVDCHTHVWQSPEQLGQLVLGDTGRGRNRPRVAPSVQAAVPAADADYHWSQTGSVDKSIVLGFKSRYMRAEIPNQYVADYVNRFPQKLVGFAGIDPTERNAIDELRWTRNDLRMRGITLSPPNQDFHPTDTRAMHVYAVAEQLGMPVLMHPGSPYAEQAKLEYGRPVLLDEVARQFPNLRLIIAQLGQPWVEEAVCLLGRTYSRMYRDCCGGRGRRTTRWSPHISTG
jgi:predicted TIM-barrel fold metal-dependent hydrolase